MQRENVISGTFPERLQDCLTEKGWTKTELSRQLGISHPAVLKWWQGQIPRSETLFKMAGLFTVNSDWLASGIGSKRGPVTMTLAEMETHLQAEGLREEMPVYGTDWKARALEAEEKLAALKTSLVDLINKH